MPEGRKRFRKGSGAEAFRQMREQSATPRAVTSTNRIYVFSATCSGCATTTEAFGLPIVHVSASADPHADVQRLGRMAHAAHVVWPTADGVFARESGWSDWSLSRFGEVAVGTVELACGVRLQDGLMSMVLPHSTPVAAVRLALAHALRHLRFEDQANRPTALVRRFGAGRPTLANPRFTALPPSAQPGSPSWVRVEDLYALDPRSDVASVASLAVGALMTATGRHGPHTSNNA